MSASKDAREEIAHYLRLAVPAGVSVHAILPPVIRPPQLALIPRSPYLSPVSLGTNPRFQLNVTVAIIVAATDLPAGVDRIEELAEAIATSLPAGIEVGDLSSPRVEDIGSQGSAVIAELDLSARIERN